MPGLNGTGPMGAGPMTGGQRGLCNPANAGYRSHFFGNGAYFNRGMGGGFGNGMGMARGFGRGPGRGFGMGSAGNRFFHSGGYPANASDELNILKAQANATQDALNAINNRISELEKSSD